MRRGRAAWVLLALLAGACGSSNDAGPAVAVEPAVLYSQMCARCHGNEGHPDAQMKKTMPTVRDFSDPELRARARNDDIEQVIMAGRNQMPAFGGLLSLPKIQSLTGYVKRLGAR
jgi:mono/diheme cytochrome c family protein